MKSRKKFLFMVCLFFFFTAGYILAFVEESHAEESGEPYVQENDEFEIRGDELIRYNGSGDTVVIPEGIAVIWEGAFKDCTTLTGIEIPDSVRQIGVKAFQNCTSLKQVKLSGEMHYINESTFEGCTSLEQITFPENIRGISEEAFSGCSALESISFPESLSNIGAYAFAGTKWMADRQAENPLVIVNGILISGVTASGSVKIPENVVRIADMAFRGAQKIVEVEISGSVKMIGTAAFEGSPSLKRVKLAKGIEYISKYSFYACGGLMDIEIPEGVTFLGDGAFAKCSSLKSVKIPGSIQSVGGDGGDCVRMATFSDCKNLENVSISEGTTQIDSSAFYGCVHLIRVEIPASVSDIGENAFGECRELTIWGQEGSFAKTYAAEMNIPFRILGSDKGIVRFDANGGTRLSFDSLEVVENGTYGKLPDAVRKGYLFDGWYTAAEGGVQITEQSVLKFPWEPTLYAHWSKISVKKVSLQKPVSQHPNKMKLKWKEVSGADGYEILYAANKKFRKPNTKTTAGKTLTVKKLKKGTIYYVKVRAYKLDSAGEKIYGAYSKKRKVKIKK